MRCLANLISCASRSRTVRMFSDKPLLHVPARLVENKTQKKISRVRFFCHARIKGFLCISNIACMLVPGDYTWFNLLPSEENGEN